MIGGKMMDGQTDSSKRLCRQINSGYSDRWWVVRQMVGGQTDGGWSVGGQTGDWWSHR